MKIITWNCCLPPWSFSRKKRLPGIISNLLNSAADLICLQEVFFKQDADLIIIKLKKFGFAYSFYFKDLLILSKLPLKKKQGFIFKNQGDLLSLAMLDYFYKKGFQLIEIKSHKEKLCLVNTHLLSASACDKVKYQIIREKQVAEICQIVDRNYFRVILTGDLNFQPTASPYQILIKNKFDDPFTKDVKTVRKGRLDYIVLKSLDCIETKVLFSNASLSDHAALFIYLDSSI